MNINLANFKKLTVALVILGLAVVGTYAVRSALHRQLACHCGCAHRRHRCGRIRCGSATSKRPKQASKAIPDRVYWGVAHIHTGYSFDAGMFGITLTPDDLFKFATGGEVMVDNGMKRQTGPAAGLARHHRPCRVSRHLRSNSRRQPRSPRQPAGQAMVRDVQDEPAGGCQSRHRSGRLHADRQACLQQRASSRPRPGRTPPRPPRSGTSRAFSPRCTASNGLPRPAATIFIAPSSSATTRTA